MKQILIIALLAITGCAQTTGYRPVIDTYGDQRTMYLQQDLAECKQIANQSSVAKGIAADGLTGALIGGAGGAALGALIGNPATGAAAGATVLGISGAAKGGIEANDTYKRIYRNCLRNRGHRVLD